MDNLVRELSCEFPNHRIEYHHEGYCSADYTGKLVVTHGVSREWNIHNPGADWNIKITGAGYCFEVEYEDHYMDALRKVVELSTDNNSDRIDELESVIHELRQRIKDLEDAILYAPGGPMYEEAKSSFEKVRL
nr:hypothetical protein K-LCC10_0257 [Kaumoebavirus]